MSNFLKTVGDFIEQVTPILSIFGLTVAFFYDRISIVKSKKEQVLRDWYNKAFLEPILIHLNNYCDKVKKITDETYEQFDIKSKLDSSEFIRYKALINYEFEKIKLDFYNQCFVPLYSNYYDVAEKANESLLIIQDGYADLFGKDTIESEEYWHFINIFYNEKGKILSYLRSPLLNVKIKFLISNRKCIYWLMVIIILMLTLFLFNRYI